MVAVVGMEEADKDVIALRLLSLLDWTGEGGGRGRPSLQLSDRLGLLLATPFSPVGGHGTIAVLPSSRRGDAAGFLLITGGSKGMNGA